VIGKQVPGVAVHFQTPEANAVDPRGDDKECGLRYLMFLKRFNDPGRPLHASEHSSIAYGGVIKGNGISRENELDEKESMMMMIDDIFCMELQVNSSLS